MTFSRRKIPKPVVAQAKCSKGSPSIVSRKWLAASNVHSSVCPQDRPHFPELLYILVEIPEPGVTKLLGQFLRHGDADAVAAAIEALVQVGDPSAARMIEPLVDDMRTVELDEDGSEGSTELTIGELAEEALEILSGSEDDDGEDESTNGRGRPS